MTYDKLSVPDDDDQPAEPQPAEPTPTDPNGDATGEQGNPPQQ